MTGFRRAKLVNGDHRAALSLSDSKSLHTSIHRACDYRVQSISDGYMVDLKSIWESAREVLLLFSVSRALDRFSNFNFLVSVLLCDSSAFHICILFTLTMLSFPFQITFARKGNV